MSMQKYHQFVLGEVVMCYSLVGESAYGGGVEK